MTNDTGSEQPRPYRRRRARRAVAATVVTGLLLLTGAYVAAAALAPLPDPGVDLTVAANQEFSVDPAPAQAAVDAKARPTAIGWLHSGEVWENDTNAYPLASISKLITVLVCQEKEPLEPGADGPIHVWSEADRDRQDAYLADDGVAYPIPVGTEVTLREMLTFIFLPSANDYAAAYAYSVFGDNDTFVAAVEDWKTRHGFASVTMVEPTGMDEGNVASAGDLLRIGRLALNNPAIAEFNRMPAASMPWDIGLIENTNPLLNELPGIIGVKTGRSSSAGYNFIAAQETSASGRPLVQMSVTLGRDSKEERAQSGRDMLGALETLPQPVEMVTEGESLGSVTTADGDKVPLVAVGSASAVLVPGEIATRVVEVTDVDPGAAGQAAGTIRVETPTGTEELKIVTQEEVEEPGLWWRLTHPLKLLGAI